MKLVIGIRSRILLTAAISAFVLTTMASFVMVETFLRLLLEESTKRLLVDSDAGACDKDPSGWTKSIPGISGEELPEVNVYAVDESSRRILYRDPVLFPSWILERLLDSKGTTSYLRDQEGDEPATYVLRRLGGDHFCRSFLFVFGENHRMRRTVEGLLFSLSCVASAFVVLIMWFFVIRPVVRRLSGLRANAQQVGGTEVYRSKFDLAGDDIGLISESLDIAHDRICKDAATLEARRVALEQHLANVAHDLRTPMASLHLVLEDLHRHIETEDGQSHLVRAIEDTTYLMVLTENLHLASKLSDGMEMMPLNVEVDLTELVERVAFRFALLGRGRGIDVVSARPDDSVLVNCDPYAAERALSNIVHNAVVYGSENGNVAVVLEVDAESFELRVSDDGPGVAPDELALLSERTFRSDDARQRDSRGNGLGLTITHEIARRANWQLKFAVLDPHGLEVTLRGKIASPDSRE